MRHAAKAAVDSSRKLVSGQLCHSQAPIVAQFFGGNSSSSRAILDAPFHNIHPSKEEAAQSTAGPNHHSKHLASQLNGLSGSRSSGCSSPAAGPAVTSPRPHGQSSGQPGAASPAVLPLPLPPTPPRPPMAVSAPVSRVSDTAPPHALAAAAAAAAAASPGFALLPRTPRPPAAATLAPVGRAAGAAAGAAAAAAFSTSTGAAGSSSRHTRSTTTSPDPKGSSSPPGS
ncbi:hypothetical protein Agub_g9017, partial [Astrephomene gubernaculifera]